MPNLADQFFGAKPKVPDLPPIDLGQEQGKAIANNQKNLSSAEGLVSSTNRFTQQEIQTMLEQAVPGYSKLVDTATANMQSELKGEIPLDVQNKIQDAAAARAVGGGYGGSGVHSDLVARDLGLTSLQLTQEGLSSFESWTREAASLFEPAMINVSSMFVTPQQQASFDVEERNAQFQRQWMQNQITAMPAPWSADIHQTVAEILSVYSGSQTQGNPYFKSGGSAGGVGGGGGFGGGNSSSFNQGYSTNFEDSSGGFGGVNFGAGGNTGVGGAAEGALIAG